MVLTLVACTCIAPAASSLPARCRQMCGGYKDRVTAYIHSITTSTAGSMQDMQKIINHFILFLVLLPAVHLFPLPAGDSPFLAIKIDREQGGVKYGYDSAVSKQEQNLVVSGE